MTEYITIMIQSLEKKVQVLDHIALLNEKQKDVLLDEKGDPDLFDEIVEEKSAAIDQLMLLDSGFEGLFEKVRELLDTDREAHKKEIETMQTLIRNITDRSVQIQAQEARNKDLMMKKFNAVKRQAKQVRVNSKATTQYYQNMMKLGVVDPQFLNKQK